MEKVALKMMSSGQTQFIVSNREKGQHPSVLPKKLRKIANLS